MSCPIRTEGQEYVCSTCGIRWDFGDGQPECPREEPRTTALLEPSSWKPPSRAELAAKLRRVIAGQGRAGIGLTPNLARDILAELERTP